MYCGANAETRITRHGVDPENSLHAFFVSIVTYASRGESRDFRSVGLIEIPFAPLREKSETKTWFDIFRACLARRSRIFGRF
jgi:hypothetical protein